MKNSPLSQNDCIFCQTTPETTEPLHEICKLTAGTLYLTHNQAYRGRCVLVFNRRHACGLEQLDAAEYLALMQNLKQSADVIAQAMQPDHMNYAALGNVVPHLHFHLVPRFRDDPRWGKSIWSDHEKEAEFYLSENEYKELIAKLKHLLLRQ